MNLTKLRSLYGGVPSVSLLVFLAGGCSSEAPETIENAPSALTNPVEEDIIVQLRNVPGIVEVREMAVTEPGRRYLALRFEQPVDHHHPDGPKFTERFTMIYRSRELPMVLESTGYSVSSTRIWEVEPARMLQANQISLEFRFFGESVPATVDYTKINAFQAAADEHRLIQALRPLFTNKWLSTGSSRGGMTAMAHRYYYPDDVEATVAYVAPHNYHTSDPRYVSFLEHVGDDPACRQKLKDFQTELLRRRAEIEPLMVQEASAYGDGYEKTLGIHRAMDATVTEASFFFWQYGETTCAEIPSTAATTQQLFGFLQKIYFGNIAGGGFGDATNTFFAPGYYHAATEQGYSGFQYSHLRPYLTPGFKDEPAMYPPFDVEKRFNPEVNIRIGTWSAASAQRVLLVYGENDPWSAGAFVVSPANDSYRYFVPKGNHSANIARLPAPERAKATATLARWMGVQIPVTVEALRSPTLEESPTPRLRW
ncbi:hypothetical protein LZC95_39855 [Pendulispora brunnea]|uniref:Uncharacterized protein n=1 Tax=Pendulispora brunnea TaxID=2905690 RepID=A0ABZ2K6Z9_9BACT